MNILKVLWRRFQQYLGTFTMLLVQGSSETALFRNLSDSVFGVRNFENTISVRVNFFSKHLKFNINFQKSTKACKNVFCFCDNCIWIGIAKLFLLRTGYLSSAANVLTSSTNILHVTILVLLVNTLAADENALFQTNFTWEWSLNMIKVLWCRFQQCLGTLPMLLVERSSETGHFRHLSNHVFGVRKFRNTKVMRVTFFFKMFKI